MADPTQEAHTQKVKDLLPSGESVPAPIEDYAEPQRPSETDLYSRRRSSMGLMGELAGTDVGASILQQIWVDTGGQLPPSQIPEITGDPMESVSNEELTRMLNRSDFATALEQGIATAQETQAAQQKAKEEQEAIDASRAEGRAGSAFGAAQVTKAEVGEEVTAGIMKGAGTFDRYDDFFNLFSADGSALSGSYQAMELDVGPGFAERQAVRDAMLKDNPQQQWLKKEITSDEFVDLMWKRVDEMGMGKSVAFAAINPVQYIVPFPVVDQLAGIALKTGFRTASEVAQLSFKLTRAGVTGGRDLMVEAATSMATWAPGRAQVAQAAPANVFGPYGEGQFRLGPGPVSADDVYTIGGVSRSPYETYVSIKGAAARGITKIRQLTTDQYAWSKNIQNEIKGYWEKANPGRAFPAAYKFATELALVAGGIHHKGMRRFTRWEDEMAGLLVSAEGERMPVTYAMRLSDLMHQYDILSMHPLRAREGVWTQDIIMRQINEIREEVTQRFQRSPRHRGEVTSWERVYHAANVISRAHKEMLYENVQSGFYAQELADHLTDLYPNYHPSKFADEQLLEGIEIVVDPVKDTNVGQMGQRLAGPDEPTIHHLADQGVKLYELENPLDVLRQTVLRHEKRRALNNIVKSTVKALRAWDWDSVQREGQLIRTFEFDRPVTSGGGRAIGPFPEETVGRVDIPVEGAAGAVAEVPTNRVGSNVAVRVPRPRARYGTENRAATEGRAKVVYWEHGKPVYVEVDANIAKDIQTLITMQPSTIRTVLRSMQFPYRAIWTQYNPAFMSKNFIFEMVTNMTVHGVMPTTTATNLIKAFKNIVVDVPLIEQMYDSNAIVLGRTGGRAQRDKGKEYIWSRTRLGPSQRQVQEGAEWTLRDSKDWKRFLFNDSGTINPLKLFNLLNETAQAFEMAPRMALFQKGLERGMGEQGAASFAREGMVDFAQAGVLVHNLDAVFLYLNAGIQGAKMPFVAFSKNPKKVGMSLAMIPALATGQYQYNRWVTNKYKDTDTPNNWDDIPAEDRYGAISFLLPGPGKKMPDGSVKPRYIKIVPIMRELALPWGGTIWGWEQLDSKVPNDMQMFWESTEDQLWPVSSILPQQANAGITDGGLDIPMINRVPYPTELGETFMSLFTNHDSFTGRDITDKTYSDPNVPKGERVTPWTSDVANNVARVTRFWEPSQVDHVIKAGGVMNDIINGADLAMRAVGLGRKVPQSVDDTVGDLLSLSIMYPDRESIRMAQNQYMSNLDFNIYKNHPDVKAANITNKKAFIDWVDVELKLRTEGDKMPWDGPIDAFIGKGGYGRYTTAKREALKKAGYDHAETRAASEEIEDIRIDQNQLQLELDAKVRSGEMSRLEWRQHSQQNTLMMRMALFATFEEFPRAAQAGRGTLAFNEYMDGVNTLMGRWPDDRSKGDILYATWLGLQADLYDADETGSDTKIIQKMGDDNTMIDLLLQDMRPLWNVQDQFLASLSEDDKELLEVKRSQYATPLQASYRHALDMLRPYYDMEDRVHAGIQDPRVREGFSKRMNGSTNQKKSVMDKAIREGWVGELDRAEGMVAAWRIDWLRRGYDDAEEWDAMHSAQILVDWDLAKMPDSPAQLLKLWDLGSQQFKRGDEQYEQDIVDRIDYGKIPVHEPWVASEDAITDFPPR